MDWWLALIPVLVSIGVVYFTIFQALRYLLQKHLFWFFAVLIFMAPFGFVLSQVSSMLELVWVLTLTPFYGVFVLTLAATTWMIRFYCFAYAILIIGVFLLRRQAFIRNRYSQDYDSFWKEHLKAIPARKTLTLGVGYRKAVDVFSTCSKKYWTVAVAIALVFVVASTFVTFGLLKNPTYTQAARFIASDRTDGQTYNASGYNCANFSLDFQANARRTGFYCGYVTLFFADNNTHALDCFNTTDRGIIYVEPQTDEIVALVVGEIYEGSVWNLPVQNATIIGFSVNW